MTLVANLSAPEVTLRGDFIEGPEDIPIYVETFGDPAATHKIVCIQGPLLRTPCFYMRCAQLSEQACYIVVYDTPWHGLSIPWEDQGMFSSSPYVWPTPRLWVESLDAVRDHLGLFEEEICLMGWSFGGQILRHYIAQRGTGGIAGLILLGAILDADASLSDLADTSPPLAQEFRTLLKETAPLDKRLDALLSLVECLWHERPGLEDYYLTLGDMIKSFWAFRGVSSMLLTAQGEAPLAETLRSVRVPTLLIQGRQDRLVTRTSTRQLVSLFQEGLLRLCEYDGCGHAPFLEHPDRFQQDVLGFLRSLEDQEHRPDPWRALT